MSAPENTIIDRELTAIDEALAGGRATAGDAAERELQELALALADDTPDPDEAFAELLSSRVHEGFPRERRLPRVRVPRLPRRAIWATGLAASLAVAVVVAVGLPSDPDVEERLSSEPEMRDLSGDEALPPEPARGGATSQSAPLPDKDFEPRGRERTIERSAQITLAAPGRELDEVADRIVAVTDRHRGFVLRSSVTSGDDSTTGGSFELRIPTDKLRPAIRDLSELGHVRSRTQSGEDVTRSVTSVRDRLAAARAERRSLLRRLENADSDDEAEAIRRRLDLVAGEIRTLRGQARDLRLRTDYATVSVSLVEEDGDEGGSGGGAGDTGDALDDALGSLIGAFNLLVRALGMLIPLGLLGGAMWFAARAAMRRRREAALS